MMSEHSDVETPLRTTGTTASPYSSSGSNAVFHQNDNDMKDDPDQVHDQLPSVEEIRMSAAAQLKAANGSGGLGGGTSRRTWWILGTVTVLCLVAIIGLAVGVSNSKDSSNRPSRVVEVEDWLVTNGITEQDDFFQDDYKAALTWIADLDDRNVPLPATSSSKEGQEFVARYVSALLYYALDGFKWKYQLDFLSGKHHCAWNQVFTNSDEDLFRVGITCNEDGQVADFRIPGNRLKGVLPYEIRHFAQLEKITLNHNELAGTLPRGLQNLSRLDYIALHYNKLTGQIPAWIGNLSNARVLGLGVNEFRDELPDSFSNLSNMITLGLDQNQLRGDITTLLNTMTDLKRLYLEDNAFTGNINNNGFLQNMPQLQDVDLSGNMFQGNVPTHLLAHTTMQVLDLGMNLLDGGIPTDLPSEIGLRYIGLHNNKLTGEIAEATLANAIDATHLDISSNEFTGTIPEDIRTMTKLNYLFLANNAFTPGPIPSWITSMDKLVDLSLKNTGRRMQIPTQIGDLTNLVMLDLDNNDLTGSIPSELGHLTELSYLLLNRNALSGRLPNELNKLSNLDLVLLDRNELTGSAAVVCAADPRFATADCEEISCKCCEDKGVCCSDNGSCHDEENLGRFDPTWEHSFARAFYEFAPSLIYDGEQA